MLPTLHHDSVSASGPLSQPIQLPTPEEAENSLDVIYDFVPGARRVVGLGNDIVVKYGPNIDVKEAETISFISQNTTIPVPKILGAYTHDSKGYIVMSRIRGTPLSDSLHSLSSSEYDSIAADMKTYLDQLRGLTIEKFEKSSFIGSIGGGECKDKIFCSGSDKRGPFTTESEMYSNICERLCDLRSWGNPKPDHSMHFIRRMYSENSNHAIRFTHGDLSPGNIMIENGHVVGILDWQEAGWYPEYWEYVNTMQGCAMSWDTPWPLQIEKFLQPYDYMRLIHLPIRAQLQ